MFELPKKSSLVADLFTTQEQRDNDKREKVIDIPLSDIDDFPDHPFQVRNDAAMQSMVESVKAAGIQTPAIVRQKEDGRYELISGHRRKMAAMLAGLEIMPVIARDLSRDEAIIAMCDANLQREFILPSEKAQSYKMRLEAMNRQAGRPRLDNLTPVVSDYKESRTNEKLGEIIGESREQIRRYIRLTELIPGILEMVDNAVIDDKAKQQMAFRPAVELSYLSKEQQNELLLTMESEDRTPSLSQALEMKQLSAEGKLDIDAIFTLLRQDKPNQIEQLKFSRERISKYFPANTPTQKIEDTIIKALELWRKREQSRDAR
ncbi:MAG: chromosome partitioning protein ParB [Clostridiales bacterium GWF2_38_85]|nr:MAG: chromosome partitioning protein ParB [Clostridiales bacterium GWF2_38_85]